MRVNGVSTIFCHASCIIKEQFNNVNPESVYWPPVVATMIMTILLPPPKNERQQSVNDVWCYILGNPWAVQRHQSINHALAAFLGKNETKEIATIS